jgi:FG-GAP-like repeat/FG-GAP repeat
MRVTFRARLIKVRKRTPLALTATTVGLAALMVGAPGASASFGTATNFDAGTFPQSVAIGDFNGDSDPDLAVANNGEYDPYDSSDPGSVSILLGGAGGSFAAPTDIGGSYRPSAVAVGDFNGDSQPDLAVTQEGGYAGSYVTVLLNTGGGFGAPTNYGVGLLPTAVAVGDFNGDADPDLAVASDFNNNVSVLLGGAGGSFGAATNLAVGKNPQSVAIGDFNGDSDPDLAVANSAGYGMGSSISILLGGAGGSFGGATNFGVRAASVAIGDFNGDSDPDLVTAYGNDPGVSILPGGVGGSFGAETVYPAGPAPTSVAVGDFNGDSDPDLAVAHGNGNTVSVLLGGAGASFGPPTDRVTGHDPTSVAIGDFNGDSRRDLAVANRTGLGTVSVLLNKIDPPQITDTDPDSPANNASPTVKGSGAEPNSTVRLYSNPSCTSAVLGTGSANQFNGATGITATVLANQTTSMWVTATDQAGNTSACSIAAFAYTEDSTAPVVAITDTDPNSPANDSNPEVKGTTEAGSTVTLFKTADCSGPGVGSGTASEFTSPGFTATVADNSTTSFYASAIDAAGNHSACSAPFAYTADSSGPRVPAITGPSSPANDNDPELTGTAQLGNTVTIYRDKVGEVDCSGPVVAMGPAALFAAEGGISVTVDDDTTNDFHATATDPSNNASACSGAFRYVEDSTPPDTSIVASPANPSNASTGGFTFGSHDGGLSFGCRVDALAFSPCGSPHTTAALTDASHTFEVAARDAAGNVDQSPASYTWTVDTIAPEAPTVTDTDSDSPANDYNPEVKGTVGSGSPTQVSLYRNDAACAGPPAATDTVAAFTGAGITVTVGRNQPTELRARTIDQAGNASACSAPIAYTEDSTPPAAPSITDSDSDSPANDNGPEVKGTAEAGSTVTLFNTPDCSGPGVVSGAASQFSNPGLTVTIQDDTTTQLYARAVDPAGNRSLCSAPFAYTEDSTSPAVPSITDTDPDSPAADNNPEVKGSLGGGDPTQIRLYKDDFACADPAGATGTVAAFTGVGITVAVPVGQTTQLRARAIDQAGNASACSAAFAYTETSTILGQTIPETTISKKPASKTPKKKATFEFASSELGSSFACKLDSKPFAPCSSPQTYKRLHPGKHTFKVQATNSAGKTDATPATYAWKVKPH